MKENLNVFRMGMRAGIPVCLGYFAVAFALGITAGSAGLSPLQATVASLLANASAGEYAAFTVIAGNGPYWEMALMMLVANARYLLMSCAFSQKLDSALPVRHRFFLAFDLTDELFGLSMSYPGKLNPFYTYGMMLVSIPGWAAGTCLGVIMGDVLPSSVVSALGVGLYGMFLAIIVPPARKSKVIGGVVLVSMLCSFAASRAPFFSALSGGTRIILLTVVIAAAAALLFPVKEEDHAA